MTTILTPVSQEQEPHGQLLRIIWEKTWFQQSPARHEFVAVATPEDEGGFSIYALHYPGIVSQGETLDEAKENIAEAFLAMLEARREQGEELEFSQDPWIDVPANYPRLRITVDG